jgi:hypothetical protein
MYQQIRKSYKPTEALKPLTKNILFLILMILTFDNVLEHDDVNIMYSKFVQEFMKTVNKHALLKTRKPCPHTCTFYK